MTSNVQSTLTQENRLVNSEITDDFVVINKNSSGADRISADQSDKAKLDELSNTVQNLVAQNRLKSKEIDDLKIENKCKSEEIAVQFKKIEDLTKESKHKSEEIAVINSKFDEFKEIISKHLVDLGECQKLIKNQNTIISSKKEKINHLKKENKKLIDDKQIANDLWKNHSASMGERRRDVEKQLQECEQKIKEEKQAREVFEQKFLDEHQAHESSEQKALEEKRLKEDFQQKFLDEHQAHESSEQKALEEKRLKEDFQQKFLDEQKLREADAEEQVSEIRNLEKKLADAESDEKLFRKLTDKYKIDCAQKADEIANLKSKLADEEGETRRYRGEIGDLKSKLTDANNETRRYHGEIDDLKSKLRDAEDIKAHYFRMLSTFFVYAQRDCDPIHSTRIHIAKNDVAEWRKRVRESQRIHGLSIPNEGVADY